MLWGSQALALNEKSQSVGICPFVVTKKMLLPGEKIFMKNIKRVHSERLLLKQPCTWHEESKYQKRTET